MEETKKSNIKSIITVGLLIAGATIGAGILGLPVQTGLSGVLPSIIGTLGIWILLTITAFIIAERFIADKNKAVDFPSVFRKEFGVIGKILVIVGYLINYYGIMIAYLCASASILSFLLPFNIPSSIYLLIFFIPVAGLTLFGLTYVLKANSLFMAVLLISFGVLLFLIVHRVDINRLDYVNWKFFPITLPIIVNAFLFHNIIPAVCHSMNNDSRKIKTSILFGTVVACIINVVWIVAVLGSLPLFGTPGSSDSIHYAYQHGQPATVPLAAALHSKNITLTGMIFSFCAIITSFISVVIGLRGFIRDILVSTFHIDSKILNIILVFGPPLAISLLYPNFFLKAMGFAGGVGGLLIFGVFPCFLWLKPKKSLIKKLLGCIFLVIFLYIMYVQIFLT